MRFAKLPDNAYKKLQFGAGVLTSDFDPEVGALALASILGATTGGINFVATPTYVDRGSDAENLPSDVKELKDLVSWKVTLSGTYISATSALFKTLMGAADASSNNGLSHVVPRNSLDLADFKTLWWIGDYSEDNNAGSGRFIAIKLTNALSTQGISLKSSNKGLGEYPFEFTAHCTYADRQVPYELFMVESESPTPTAQYQEKQVTPANYQLEVSADAGYVALSRVIVKAIELSSLPTITSNGTYTTSEAGFSSPVVVNVAGGSALQSKTVTPTAAQQVVIPDSGYDALSQVTVNAAPLQVKSATPTTAAQTIGPDGTNIGLSAVSVGAVTSAIDANIAAANIKSGVSILGVTGTYTGGSGGSTINGELFDCGSFTLTSAVTSAYTISHSLGSTPSAAFLWVTNPSYATKGIIGKYRTDTSSESNSASIIAANGGLSTNDGASFSRFRLGWSATDLTVNCDATYPLLAGLTYQWLVIAQ